jgi:hypothetical protein
MALEIKPKRKERKAEFKARIKGDESLSRAEKKQLLRSNEYYDSRHRAVTFYHGDIKTRIRIAEQYLEHLSQSMPTSYQSAYQAAVKSIKRKVGHFYGWDRKYTGDGRKKEFNEVTGFYKDLPPNNIPQ